MAKSANQKSKLLYLAKIFQRCTDTEHGLTLPEIADKLEGYGISAERKTLYQDIEELRLFGYDIGMDKEGRSWKYRLLSREFELPELKLLVDSIQASRFITEKKSESLIAKLENLVSMYEAPDLNRQVLVSGRVKALNEQIYYNVDSLHKAIANGAQISFRYFQWNEKKERVYRHDGAAYRVSPWGLHWDNQNYYLIAYDSEAKIIKHYRVDKMEKIAQLPEKRQGREAFETLKPRYSGAVFGMFTGKEQLVTLTFANEMTFALIDRFGMDLPITRLNDELSRVSLEVCVSDNFLTWVMSLGGKVRVTAPEDVVEKMRDLIRKQSALYGME